MRRQGKPAPSAVVAALGVTAMAVEWILLVATLKIHEMLVGGLSVLAAGLFLWHVHRTESLELHFQVRDIVTVWRLPREVLSDAWMICVVLFKDFNGERANSLYRVTDFVTEKNDPIFAARRVLATVYSTASPNLVVIGVDCKQSRMLFHQVKRSGISKMTQALGARP